MKSPLTKRIIHAKDGQPDTGSENSNVLIIIIITNKKARKQNNNPIKTE